MFSKLPQVGSLILATLYLSATAAAYDNFTLVGFADGISVEDAVPIFYVDGAAFIGSGSTANFSEVTNISFTTTSKHSFEYPFQVIPDSITFAEPQYLAVDSASSYSPVQFIGAAEAVNGFNITGFGFYGDILAWESADGTLEGGWWALPTDVDDLWSVIFAPDGDTSDDGAVVLTIQYRDI